MAKAITLEPTVKEATELQAQISHYLIEAKRLGEQMARDQGRIDTLKDESRVIAVETRVLVESLRQTLSRMSAA